MFKILNKLKFFFSSLNILIATKKIKPRIIFFSENKVYQKFSKPIIETISSVYPDKIYYFSIDKDDKIDHESVRNYFVDPILLNYVFIKKKRKRSGLVGTRHVFGFVK